MLKYKNQTERPVSKDVRECFECFQRVDNSSILHGRGLYFFVARGKFHNKLAGTRSFRHAGLNNSPQAG